MGQVRIEDKIFLIPDAGSPCDTWKTYFSKLSKDIGKENARVIWLMTWKANGSLSCTTSEDFNKFLKKNNIDVSIAATRAIADISAIGGNILGLGKTMSRIFSIAVPVVLSSVVIVTIILLLRVAKKADIVDIALLASGGAGRTVLAAKQISK